MSTSKKIESDLVSKEFGQSTTESIDRPAFVSLATMSNGSQALNVTLYVYGRHLRSIFFYAKDKAVVMDAVDTYLEWEKQATANREILAKRIATVKIPNSTPIFLSFRSKNETDHFLAIGFLESGRQDKAEFPLLMFDRKNAEEFKELLKQLPDLPSR